MRKADYALLARLIQQARTFSKEREDHHLLKALEAKYKPDTEMHEKQIRYYQGRDAALVGIAHGFAYGAHVDKKAFLSACGVE